MNGPHDLGGKHGLGPVRPDADERLFREEWERRMFGLSYCILASGAATIDASRHAAESMPHAHYLGSSYYEHWLYAYQRVLDANGICTREEIERRMAEQAGKPDERPAGGEPSELARRVIDVVGKGRIKTVPGNTEPAFREGDRVRARNLHTKRHLRLPAYAKGREGVVEAYYGHFEHPEAKAHGEPDPGAHLYRVGFQAAELWGPDAERPDDVITLDILEDYLEPVE